MTEEKEEETVEQIPTPEFETLKSELDAVRVELEQTKKGLSTAHATATEKDKELKRRADIESQIQTLADKVELMAAYVASSSGESEESLAEMPTQKKQDLLKQLDEKEKQRKQEKEQSQLVQTITGLQARVEALGLSPDTEEYVEIQDLAETGRFRMAEIKLKKLESKTKTETSKESDDERIEKLAEEKARKVLEEKGLLDTDITLPSGVRASKEEAMKEFIAGNIDSEEAERRGVNFH